MCNHSKTFVSQMSHECMQIHRALGTFSSPAINGSWDHKDWVICWGRWYSLFRVLLRDQLVVAMVSEMIHTASLVHDDIIDGSLMRRGGASAFSIWGEWHVAIIVLLPHNPDMYTGNLFIKSILPRRITLRYGWWIFQCDNIAIYKTAVNFKVGHGIFISGNLHC